MKPKTAVLKPVDFPPELIERIDKYLAKFFKVNIYQPLMREVKNYGTLKNSLPSNDPLLRALQSGQVSYYRGYFTGKFNASVSKKLRSLGATWSSKNNGSYRLLSSKLPDDVKRAVMTAESSWLKQNDLFNRKLDKIAVSGIVDKIDLTALIAKSLYKLDADIEESFRGLVVAPKLSEENVKDIAENYTNNMKYYVQKFTDTEIEKLRTMTKENVFSGQRYEGLAKEIEKSYGVSQSKALFLAKQETHLLMAKFKESRYNEAGVDEYIWQTVIGSPNHPVRPMHQRLNGMTFSFKNPPIVNKKGDRKNPGEDYNCRCKARPVVRF